MKVKIYLGVFIILFTVFVGQNSVVAQSSQIDLELIESSENGDIDRVRELIASGANVNVTDKDEWTALMVASSNGHIKVVKELIKEGANVNFTDNVGYTALMVASSNGHIEVVKELIKEGANVNFTDKYGDTVLMVASMNGRIEVVKELIKAGANVNAVDNVGLTELMWASVNGHIEVVNLLKTINEVEENQEEFINQSDEIKNILINRWINLYKENRSKLLIDRLKMAEFHAEENEKEEIRELLSSIIIKRPEQFADIVIKTV